MYKFSVPMAYNVDDINKILNINKVVEKSRIISLYACVPRGCEVFTGFEQPRNLFFKDTSWDYWKRLINQTLDNNCDFIYLLNLPKPLDIDNPDFPKSLEKLELLLTELKKIGVKKLRVAAGQLMSYIAKHYSDFEILASTSLEYKTIWEYQNFIAFHPEVKQIVPSHDVNKNFKLLSHLRKRYPNVEIELMVNEGCMQGCPNRMFHEMTDVDKHTIINNDICLSGSYASAFCNALHVKYPIQSIILGTHIFPWDIPAYSKIGITNFKLVGRDNFEYFEEYVKNYKLYLLGLDNIENIEDYAFSDFVHHLKNNKTLKNLMIKNYKKYLPDINHFVKYGHLCTSYCGIECKYCYNCADKMLKAFRKKQKEERKKTVPICVPS